MNNVSLQKQRPHVNFHGPKLQMLYTDHKLHSTNEEKVKYSLIRQPLRASTPQNVEVSIGIASRSKLNKSATKNLGMNVKP
jgi:hypothetical protein